MSQVHSEGLFASRSEYLQSAGEQIGDGLAWKEEGFLRTREGMRLCSFYSVREHIVRPDARL